jgi:hypothetical protein
MTTYARIDAQGAFDRLIDLTPEQYVALQANGKAAWLRLWIVDAKPVPTATQLVIDAGIVITATEAHQTWAVREKTAAELEAESIAAERNSSIDGILTDIATQRAVTRTTWDAYTAAQLRAEQWKDRQVLLRFANLLARRMKQEVQ